MKRSIISILSLLVLCVSTIIAQKAQPETAKPKETRGLLYKISGKDIQKPSYIFGTIHVICPNDMFSQENLGKYFDETEQLILEIDMDDAAEMQTMTKAVYLQNGKTLSEAFSPEQLKKVDELLKNYLGIPLETVKTIKPIMLQTMLLTSPKVIGCAPAASYETTFLQMASAKKKQVLGLETVQSQIDVLDKTPFEKQIADFYEMALDPEKSFAEFTSLLETYKQQNSDDLFALIEKQMEKDKTFQTNLLDERNKLWIPKIENAVKEKPSFIAVGGGHLGGKNGVLNLLKAKGYKIEAIKL